MLTVSTQRVCTSPRYVTIPVLFCVHAVIVFLKYVDDLSAHPPNPILWTYPLIFVTVALVSSLLINVLYYKDVSISLDGTPRYGTRTHLFPCFLLVHAVLFVSSTHVLLGRLP